jgi:hypothetical protein
MLLYDDIFEHTIMVSSVSQVLAQNTGAEGFQLHGGVTAPVTGKFQPHLEYSYRHGTMHNMLIGCTLQLVDHDPGDGGFCIGADVTFIFV